MTVSRISVGPGWLLPTFEVRDGGRGGGLREAPERGLLPGGVVRRSVLLLVLLLVGAHGLERQLLPEEHNDSVSGSTRGLI